MITKPLLAVQADLNKIKYPVIASPKLDGIRCLIINGVAVSRNFKPIPNKYIRELLSDLPDGFDGEIMLRKRKASFQEITSAVMSFDGEPDFIYWVFDWVRDGLNIPFKVRKETLAHWNLVSNNKTYVRRLTQHELNDCMDFTEYEERSVELGFEGIMLRDPDGPYKCGRSTVKEGILLKVKRFEDAEAVIVGFVKRQKNNNEQTRDELGRAKRSTAKAGKVNLEDLGAFIVKDTKTDLEFQIGSGLNDDIRSMVWKNRTNYYDKIIKYKYQATGVKEAPRFPVFLGFRDIGDL